MKQLILHIGRHKTGTTAIQHFLLRNRDLLQAHNFHYPTYGIRGFGHHELGTPLTRANLTSSMRHSDEIVEEIRQNLKKEVGCPHSTILISSESFQNCDPRVVRKLFPDYEVTVVVYLREQVRYLVSAYTQKVQATNYSKSLEEFHAENSSKNYQEFLDEWNKEFNSQVIVRNYDRKELAMGNVVVDFCEHVLEIDSNTVINLCSEVDANPSLTSDLLEFKLRVNQHSHLPPEQAEKLYNGLAKLSIADESGKMLVSQKLIRRVDKHFRKSNAFIARHYFNRKQLFTPYEQPVNTPLQQNLDQRLAKIRSKLLELSPELSDSLPHI